MSTSNEEEAAVGAYSSTILQNRGYKLISQVGKGKYSKVYLSEFTSPTNGNTSSEPTVIQLATKIIDTKPSGYCTRKFVKKFLPRELNVLTQINHPYIIHIHSILRIRHKYYFFMRYAERHDLHEYILKHNKNVAINENQARVWTRQIALALQYLHALNIAHRDMKCENILITQNYNVKLADFDFARYTIDAAHQPILSDTYCGTLSYASPEILDGQPYDPKLSDIWSFGVIIFVMLNNGLPFTNGSVKELHEKQINKTFNFNSKNDSTVSFEAKYLVENLLEPNPLKRFSIENVIASAWIAMDKRLTALTPTEQAAMVNAVEITPPVLITTPIIETNKDEDESKDNEVIVIKPYTTNQQQRPSDCLEYTAKELEQLQKMGTGNTC